MSVRWFAGTRINTELLDHEPPKQRNRISHRPIDNIVVARRREVLDAHEAHGWLVDRARSAHRNHAVRRLRYWRRHHDRVVHRRARRQGPRLIRGEDALDYV